MYKPKIVVKLKPFVSWHFQHTALYKHSTVSLKLPHIVYEKLKNPHTTKNTSHSMFKHTINIKSPQTKSDQQNVIPS